MYFLSKSCSQKIILPDKTTLCKGQFSNIISLSIGICDIKKSFYEKRYDENLKEYYFAEIEGGFSKNHRTDDEGSREEKGSTIPFRISKKGLNPGQYLEDWMKTLNPNNPFLFQKPR